MNGNWEKIVGLVITFTMKMYRLCPKVCTDRKVVSIPVHALQACLSITSCDQYGLCSGNALPLEMSDTGVFEALDVLTHCVCVFRTNRDKCRSTASMPSHTTVSCGVASLKTSRTGV